MSDPRLDPPLSATGYAVRAPLARWLAAEASRAADDLGPYRLLDVGCGEMPYLALFQPHVREVVGLDAVPNPLASLVGPIEAIPAPDASFDVVLCAQVLEHVDDPARGVAELHRVLRPGGRVLLSTHGTMVYHPNPVDLWRWTGPGLERLFAANGAWDSITVSAGAGTAASLAMLNGLYLDHVFRRGPLRPLRRPVVSLVNRLGRALDGRLPRAARRAARDARRQLPRRRREARVTRVLVTGGAGFIGSNLAHALMERGDEVRVLDNFSTGRRANLASLGREIEVVEGDLRSYERVHTAVRGVDVVFHQGALGSVPRSVQDPLTTTAVNVEGTLNVLLAARDEDVRRVVFASSSSVYGNAERMPLSEEQAPNPISPYGVAKLAAERFCVSFGHVYGLETVALRYFNVFGPRQDPSSQYAAVVPRFIRAVAEGRTLTIDGDGSQSKDFTHVANVVAANLLAADAAGAAGRVLNVAMGGSESVNDLAELIGRLLGKEVERVHGPDRPGDVRLSCADISAARDAIGYEPVVGFEEGLQRTIDAMLDTEGGTR